MFETLHKKDEKSEESVASSEGINLLPDATHSPKPKHKKSPPGASSHPGDYHVPQAQESFTHQGKWIKKDISKLKKKSGSFWKNLFSLKKIRFPKSKKLKNPGIVELGEKINDKPPASLGPAKRATFDIAQTPNLVTDFAASQNKPGKAPAVSSFNEVHQLDKEKDDEVEVNLLPIEKKHLTKSQIIFTFIITASICLMAIATPYFYYKGKNQNYKSNVAEIEEKTAQVAEQIAAEKEKIINFGPLAMKLEALQELFASHIYWSEFFPTLEQNTSRHVQFNTMAVEGKTISLSGEALDLRSAGEQFIVFRAYPSYLNVTLTDLSFTPSAELDTNIINLSFNFDISPNVIHKSNSAQ